MKFSLNNSMLLLEKTPTTLTSLLNGLSEDWLKSNEGKNTWSPYDIVGHLIHGEKTNWMIRIQIILNESANKHFTPYDRFAQMHNDQNKQIAVLLEEFSILRSNNIQKLKSFRITDFDLTRKGIHPEFGEITLEQLIAAWVVHDLGHIAQISRVMAKQYKDEVGPWTAYLGILK